MSNLMQQPVMTLLLGSVVMILSFLSNGIVSEKMTSPTEVVSYDLFDPADSEPWLTPCGHVIPEVLKNSSSKTEIKDILKNVQLQLQSANAKYQTDINTVREVYSQVRRVLQKPKQHYRLSWLPKNQWSWYKNKIACFDDKRKAKFMLPRLYKTMQLYAITFYQLLHFHPNSAHTSSTNVTLIRNEIVNRTHMWSHIVLCEVETSVETLDITVALPHNKRIVTEHPHYQSKGDLTRMLIQDWGIFNFYKSFLNEWLEAFNDATAEGPGICNREMKLNPKVTNNKKSTRGKKMSKMRKLTKLSTKYVLATIFNQNTSLPSLLENPQKESIRKKLLTKKPMRKTPLRKRFPKNRLMRNKRKKLSAQEQT
ncbi:uncharacterized protein [Linepithema humile]|uniref:uncharacterized protein isoform X2 n=1 Tax=Linepithema humile TaxID=83485 RepID=UPI0006236A43|nr:PREDICTED: uncharacterized protein LOC105672250 isoform X2 [Linepithema humile]